MEIVCLRCCWLVNPPLLDSRLIEIVGGGGAGLWRWFVCGVVGWLTRPYRIVGLLRLLVGVGRVC